MKELFERINALEHERGRGRQALADLARELDAMVLRIHTFLDCSATPRAACTEERADSDPRQKEST